MKNSFEIKEYKYKYKEILYIISAKFTVNLSYIITCKKSSTLTTFYEEEIFWDNLVLSNPIFEIYEGFDDLIKAIQLHLESNEIKIKEYDTNCEIILHEKVRSGVKEIKLTISKKSQSDNFENLNDAKKILNKMNLKNHKLEYRHIYY